MENAFYYREGYYLLPDGCSNVDALKAGIHELPAEIQVRQLVEDHQLRGMVQKGICIAPYFYAEYGFPEQLLTIEDVDDIFPVEATLLTQEAYNKRLREVVLEYCPGCCRYKPLSNRVQSLNGHFEEISLNSVCFYRQNSKPAPRVFRRLLQSFGGLSYHFDPAGRSADDLLDFIKEVLYIKYTSCEKNPAEPIFHVSYKPNFFVEQLTLALSEYIEKHLTFTKFRIAAPASGQVSRAEIEALWAPEKLPTFQKECKKYGVSLAILTYDAASASMKRCLSELFFHDYARILCEEPGELCLLLMDSCTFLKELHFRAPYLRSCDSKIEIHDQYGIQKYAISFDMEPLNGASDTP